MSESNPANDKKLDVVDDMLANAETAMYLLWKNEHQGCTGGTDKQTKDISKTKLSPCNSTHESLWYFFIFFLKALFTNVKKHNTCNTGYEECKTVVGLLILYYIQYLIGWAQNVNTDYQ